MEFYGRLQDEEGDLGIRQVGLLFPALSEAGVEMLRQEEEREREFADVHMLDADETCMLAPLLAREAVARRREDPAPAPDTSDQSDASDASDPTPED